MIDIIIISATKNKELQWITQNAINSCHNSVGNFNIVVIETFNKDQKYDNATVIPFIEDEFNYNRTINFGLSKTKNKIVGFFNNDIEFSKNWFVEIEKGLKKYDSVSPRCPYSNKESIALYTESWLLRVGINGWAIVINRKILKKIGKLNEQVKFWSSDDIYSEQLKQKNIKHALCNKSIVKHLGSKTLATVKENRIELTINQEKIFKDIEDVHNYTFSIIMPSFLGEYKGAAKNREEKFIRAIDSILNQTFKDFELIIVADGCEKTVEIYKQKYADNENIKCYLIPKQPYMSGAVRQIGLQHATGKYIIYCDSDDMYTEWHLDFVNKNIQGLDWAYYNDNFKFSDEEPESKKTVILEYGIAGTSSICHKRLLNAKWSNINQLSNENCDGYGHDWRFIEIGKKKSTNYKHIGQGGYLICHVPGSFDY